jgi:hypothetical protein
MLGGPEYVLPIEAAQTGFGPPPIEQTGNGLTVKVAAVEVAVPQLLEKKAR